MIRCNSLWCWDPHRDKPHQWSNDAMMIKAIILITSCYCVTIQMYMTFSRFIFMQHDVPPGKHALITVKQPKGNILWIQTPKNVAGANKKKNSEKEKFVPHLTTWDDCDIIQVCNSNVFPKRLYH